MAPMDRQQDDRPLSSTLKIDQRRYLAALRLRGGTLADIARKHGRTERHLQFVLRGERPVSEYLLAALQEAVGREGWLFATGKTDFLRDPHKGANHGGA